MRRLLVKTLLASAFLAGCDSLRDREQFSFSSSPLDEPPADAQVQVTALPGQIVIDGYFTSCPVSRLRASVRESGSTLTLTVSEGACDGATGTTISYAYHVLWFSLAYNRTYTLEVEHRGEAGQSNRVVFTGTVTTL